MPPFLYSCSICSEDIDINEFRWSRCGHGFCSSCLTSLFGEKDQAPCPHCRAPLRPKELHPIFFQMEVPQPDPIADVKEIVRGVNRSKSLITASQLRACRDKLQIITLQERVDWEKNLHSRCTAKQELIDKLAQEAEEQKERIRVYESKIQNLEEEVDKLKKRPKCGHCLLALAQNFSSRLRHE